MDEARECRDRVVALDLMRMALALLDRAGGSPAGARLQHAIDTLGGIEPGPADPEDIERLLR